MKYQVIVISKHFIIHLSITCCPLFNRMFKNIFSKGKLFLNRSVKPHVPEQLPRKFIIGSVVVSSSAMVLFTGYKYNESNDIRKVINMNNLQRNGDEKVNISWKMTQTQLKKEIETYLILGVKTNDIDKLKFISQSKLNDDAPWNSYALLNQCIIMSDLKILNFVLGMVDEKNLIISINYLPKMYQCIIRSLSKINNPDKKLIMLVTDTLSKYLHSMNSDQKNKLIDGVFWQISRINISENQDEEFAFNKIKLILDHLIAGGCDPDAIDFRHILHIDQQPMRYRLTRYLINNKMDIMKEIDGRNFLFLIEERIHRNHDDQKKVTMLRDLYNLVTSSSSLKYPGTDCNGLSPEQRNNESKN